MRLAKSNHKSQRCAAALTRLTLTLIHEGREDANEGSITRFFRVIILVHGSQYKQPEDEPRRWGKWLYDTLCWLYTILQESTGSWVSQSDGLQRSSQHVLKVRIKTIHWRRWTSASTDPPDERPVRSPKPLEAAECSGHSMQLLSCESLSDHLVLTSHAIILNTCP